MELQEVDTVKDLREWVGEHMQGAEVHEDMHGNIIIHTGLMSTMGGYLHESGGE